MTLLAACEAPRPSSGRTVDLILAMARSQRHDDGVRIDRAVSGGVIWSSICLKPPGEVGFTVKVPPAAILETSVGIDDRTPGASPLAISIDARSGRHRSRLWSTTLDPRLPAHRGWLPVRLDLSRLWGQEVELILGVDGLGSEAGGAAFAAPQVRSPGTPPGHTLTFRQGSVVLVSLDTFRVDRLGACGHPGMLTPRLDRFLRTAQHLVDATSPSHWTLPSHMSALTSTYPDVHGVSEERPLHARVPTLAETLKAKGYRTAGFPGSTWLRGDYGFARGFDLYLDTEEPSASRVRRVREHLESVLGCRIFLFVHFIDTHSDYRDVPYEASPESIALHAPRAARAPRCSSAELGRRAKTRSLFPAGRHRAIVELYDASVMDLDREVAKLLAELDGVGLGPRSIIGMFSDHGEEFGEHGGYLHGRLWAETTQALLAFARPGRPGRIVRGQASLVDVPTTLLALAGHAPPDAWQGRDVTRLRAPTSYAFSSDGSAVLRDDRFTLFRHPGGRGQVFDRWRDPGELDPVPAGAHPMRAALQDVQSRHRRLAAGLETDPTVVRAEEDRQHLRALGYLQ